MSEFKFNTVRISRLLRPMTEFYFSWNLLSLEIYRSTLFKDCVIRNIYCLESIVIKNAFVKLFHRIAIYGPIRGFLYIYFAHCSLISNTIFSYVYYLFSRSFCTNVRPKASIERQSLSYFSIFQFYTQNQRFIHFSSYRVVFL